MIPIILSGCGGGNSSSIQSNSNRLFSSTPMLLPNLYTKYDRLCGDKTNVQNMIPIDVNKDGRMDLVFNLWCSHQPFGDIYDGPVINSLIALIQNSDGNFVDKTVEVFGTDYPDLGGTSNAILVKDFNSDGYMDIIFAMSREDGRGILNDDISNHFAQNKAVMSNGNGKYTITPIGTSTWNASLSLIDNEVGTQDIWSTSFGPPGSEIYRYQNGWSVSKGDARLGFGSLFFSRRNSESRSNISTTPFLSDNIFGLSLLSRTDDLTSDWSLVSSYSYGTFTYVPWISWQLSEGSVPMLTINGKDYVAVSLDSPCEISLIPGDPSSAVYKFTANELIGGYQGGVVKEGTNMTPVAKIQVFDITNNYLTLRQVVIKNEEVNSSDYRKSCGDVNGDGYDDIMIHDWRPDKKPIIYINDQSGGFARVDYNVFPKTPYGSQSYVYMDIDGDGIRDILYWPVASAWAGYPNVQYRIYKGLRNIDNTDILK